MLTASSLSLCLSYRLSFIVAQTRRAAQTSADWFAFAASREKQEVGGDGHEYSSHEMTPSSAS